MNLQSSESEDPRLHEVLREWQVTSDLPPHFSEQVWRCVARQESQGLWSALRVWWSCFAMVIARPRLAAAYLTLMLFVGLGIGVFYTQQTKAQMEASLSRKYLAALDPYQPRR